MSGIKRKEGERNEEKGFIKNREKCKIESSLVLVWRMRDGGFYNYKRNISLIFFFFFLLHLSVSQYSLFISRDFLKKSVFFFFFIFFVFNYFYIFLLNIIFSSFCLIYVGSTSNTSLSFFL